MSEQSQLDTAERRVYVNRRICELRKQRDSLSTEIEELISEWRRLV